MGRRSATPTIALVAAAAVTAGCGATASGQRQAARPASAVGLSPQVLAVSSASGQPTPLTVPQRRVPRRATPAVVREELPAPRVWRSVAAGRPNDGRLIGGVPLPAVGPHHISYDPILHQMPNREWRRYGTDRLVWSIQAIAASFRQANPDAPPLLIGDLSRPRGGVFDQRFGGLGHASHQNGLDVDIQYPRKDRRLVGIRHPSEVDRRLAQDLVDRWVAAGARFVFVGKRVRLKGPPGVVQAIPHHDDHLHVRIP